MQRSELDNDYLTSGGVVTGGETMSKPVSQHLVTKHIYARILPAPIHR